MTKETCIYCARPADSEEHIFATRFIEVLLQDPRTLKVPITLTISETGNQPRQIRGKRNRRGKHTLEYTTNVCTKCNNEWMNVIDDKAFPIVAKMIRGESVILDPRTQSDLALWICKIVVTARSINHRDLPGDIKWAEWLYQRREPLPDWQIWIAHYVGSAPFYYQTHGIDVREPPGPNQSPSEMPIIDADGAMATLTMGYFVAQIFGFSSSMKWAATETQGFPRIWPMSKFLIPWPSFPSLDDNGLRFAAQRLLATKVPGLPVHSDEVKPIS